MTYFSFSFTRVKFNENSNISYLLQLSEFIDNKLISKRSRATEMKISRTLFV